MQFNALKASAPARGKNEGCNWTRQTTATGLHLNLYGRSFQSSVNHRQHAVLDVLRRSLRQQEVHLLQEDQQDLHRDTDRVRKEVFS